MQASPPEFPAHCSTIGKRIEYLSQVLIPEGRFEDYLQLMQELLDPKVHYIDPVHEFNNCDEVLQMLRKYVPRSQNGDFSFDLLVDGEREVMWRWRIGLRLRFIGLKFIINGLVHAQIEKGKICYQREYYDPMESIGIIPVVGWLYKLMLRLG